MRKLLIVGVALVALGEMAVAGTDGLWPGMVYDKGGYIADSPPLSSSEVDRLASFGEFMDDVNPLGGETMRVCDLVADQYGLVSPKWLRFANTKPEHINVQGMLCAVIVDLINADNDRARNDKRESKTGNDLYQYSQQLQSQIQQLQAQLAQAQQRIHALSLTRTEAQ